MNSIVLFSSRHSKRSEGVVQEIHELTRVEIFGRSCEECTIVRRSGLATLY